MWLINNWFISLVFKSDFSIPGNEKYFGMIVRAKIGKIESPFILSM